MLFRSRDLKILVQFLDFRIRRLTMLLHRSRWVKSTRLHVLEESCVSWCMITLKPWATKRQRTRHTPCISPWGTFAWASPANRASSMLACPARASPNIVLSLYSSTNLFHPWPCSFTQISWAGMSLTSNRIYLSLARLVQYYVDVIVTFLLMLLFALAYLKIQCILYRWDVWSRRGAMYLADLVRLAKIHDHRQWVGSALHFYCRVLEMRTTSRTRPSWRQNKLPAVPS